MKKELTIAIEAALAAGKAIMQIYGEGDFQIEAKADESPLTIADKKANDIINEFLLPTAIPVISEENQQIAFRDRKDWSTCWIVDPLDGTKEFIKRNGEFTVNIALIENNRPIMGVVYAPALGRLYFTNVSEGKAFKVPIQLNENTNLEVIIANAEEIKPSELSAQIKVVGSRSHMNEDTINFIETLKRKYTKPVEIVSTGSSLKFCLVAEGTADIYPRFAPTMEWDTAAGQAICEAVGLNVVFKETGKPITYNRENLLNGHFLVSNERQVV